MCCVTAIITAAGSNPGISALLHGCVSVELIFICRCKCDAAVWRSVDGIVVVIEADESGVCVEANISTMTRSQAD